MRGFRDAALVTLRAVLLVQRFARGEFRSHRLFLESRIVHAPGNRCGRRLDTSITLTAGQQRQSCAEQQQEGARARHQS